MKQSKLLALLRVLSKAQLQQCSELLPALLVNKNNEILGLFLYLRPYAPHFKHTKLDKKTVAKELKISVKKLSYHASALLKALEKCILTQQLLEDPLARDLALLKYYEQVRLDKHYQGIARRLRKRLAAYPYEDATFWEYTQQLLEVEARWLSKYERNFHPELQRAADALDHTYLNKKLPYLLEMTNAGLVLDIPYELHLAKAVKQWADREPFRNSVLITLYAQAVKLLENPTKNVHFEALRNLLKEHEELVPPSLLKDFYTYLLNFCTQKIRVQNDSSYYEHFLDLNTYLIAQGMLFEEGFLPPWRYSNLVTVGLRTGRIAWAREFLEQQRDHLPPAERTNIYDYNLAHCLFYEKDYDTAQRLLNQLDLHDLLLAVAAKNLLVKIYWETDATELLISFLEAYRIYIYRQALAKPKLKAQVKAFITLVRQMVKTPAFDTEKRKKIAASIPPTGSVLERDWLLEQLLP